MASGIYQIANQVNGKRYIGSTSLKGKCRSKEHRRKLSEAQKGKHVSEETRRKMSMAWTPERRQRQSDRMRRKRWLN